MNPRPKIICKVPGCGEVIGPRNLRGICLHHGHLKGFCGCPICRGDLAPRRGGLTDRPGVRQVEVAIATGNSGIEGRQKISLPREPWLPEVAS